MSWSAYIIIPKGSTAAKVRALLKAAPVSGNDDCPAERDAQVKLARTQAAGLIRAGVVGPVEACAWEVFLSGHANPGNVQRREWSSGRVQVAVQQKTLDPPTQINAGDGGGGRDR